MGGKTGSHRGGASSNAKKTQAIKKDTRTSESNRPRTSNPKNIIPQHPRNPISKDGLSGDKPKKVVEMGVGLKKVAKDEQVGEVMTALGRLEDVLNNYEELEMVDETNIKILVDQILRKGTQS